MKIEYLSDRVLMTGMGGAYYDAVIAINTAKGIVVIDAGRVPSVTKKYRKIIEKEFGRNDFKYLINTHGHFDHMDGNQVFSDVIIIGHKNVQSDFMKFWNDSAKVNQFIYHAEDRLRKRLASFEEGTDMWTFYKMMLYQTPILVNDLKNDFKYTFPTVTFSDRLSLYLGDVTFDLIYFGEAHTTSDILIHVPEEKMLFIGDLFDSGGEPDFEIADSPASERWLQVLESLLQPDVEIDRVIYGHGLVFPKTDLIRFYQKIRDVLSQKGESDK